MFHLLQRPSSRRPRGGSDRSPQDGEGQPGFLGWLGNAIGSILTGLPADGDSSDNDSGRGRQKRTRLSFSDDAAASLSGMVCVYFLFVCQPSARVDKAS